MDSLLEHDEYLVLADFADYARAQREVAAAWKDTEGWPRKAIYNVARVGRFSSDRTIHEYARDIWRIQAVPVPPAGSDR